MFWGSLLWSHFIAMISRDPFCLLAQCGTRVVLIPSGALYTLISCCMFLPEKQTKTWSEDETEQVCRQTETHWAGLASEHKLIAIQKIMGGRSHYDFQIRSSLPNVLHPGKDNLNLSWRTGAKHVNTTSGFSLNSDDQKMSSETAKKPKGKKRWVYVYVTKQVALEVPHVECACVKNLQGGFWFTEVIVPTILLRRLWKRSFV